MMYFARWKVTLILAVLALGCIFALPNLLPLRVDERIPSWLPHQRVSLGLDLQGGSHLLLAADIDSVIHERLTSVVDAIRADLRKANIGYTGLGIEGKAVTLKLRDPAAIEQARGLLQSATEGMDLSIAEDGTVKAAFTDAKVNEIAQNAIQQSIEIVRRRVDETGTREPIIQRQGSDQILVQLPGLQDPERVKSLLGKTAKMTFQLVDENVSLEDAAAGRLPPTDALLPVASPRPGEPASYVVQKRIMVGGESLTDAQATFQDAQPVVSFKFDSLGARRFCDATKNNIGRPFAIVLDNKVISAPVIRDAICGGAGIISGNFTVQSAQDLALLLRAGALPAPLKIIEERSVGPDLGADSIRAGIYACIIGFVLVATYMVLAYGLFGLFADVALIFNLILTIAALSLLQATLTLPGIAGMLLTLGMSVDANVLINERIREETRLGRSPIAAMDAGYRRAFATILDSNLTTLIKMALLYVLGSGSVKGFAVTISLGICTSMFTAILVVRWIMSVWLRRTRPAKLAV
ncbi:MAG TPA: protein translocase subunit SecD [Dongiaceae bacterium]|nr:protein translocase subunit SecD [Dongiaceae bacterium]